MKKSFADILKGVSDQQSKKVAAKLPEWAGTEGLVFPSALCLEQCSSTAAALYKAGILARTAGRTDVVDLTSGLGVDCWGFSREASHVTGFEANPELAAASSANMKKLGADNVEIRNGKVGPDTEIPRCGLIFADPARRDGAGKKVFLLEDCSPNILELLPAIFSKSPLLLLKLSPMADISMVADRLGRRLREVHIVSLKGEVKELLCLMDRDWDGDYCIIVRELGADGGEFRFAPSEERDAEARFIDSLEPGRLLYEPSAAMLKSGAFKLICSRFSAAKLARFTHLYQAGETLPLGRSHEILEVLPFGNAAIREAGRRYPTAEVTARNIPMSSEQLRAKLGVKSGTTDIHIFGCTALESKVLIVTRTL